MRHWTLAHPTVSAFVSSIVRDFTARDDVLQEIAVAAIESFDRYATDRPFVPWAMGIARNQIRLYLRREKRNRLLFDDNVVEQLAVAFEATTEQSTSLGFLRDCLGALEGRAKQICELRYVENHKPAAIAERVKMTANSVAKSLQRIRDQLRECIERKSLAEGGSS